MYVLFTFFSSHRTKAEDFMTTSGKPIKHAELIMEVLEALWLPKEVAIKIHKAYAEGTNKILIGNRKQKLKLN